MEPESNKRALDNDGASDLARKRHRTDREVSEAPSEASSERTFRGFSEEPPLLDTELSLPSETRLKIFEHVVYPLIEARDVNGALDNIKNWSSDHVALYLDAQWNFHKDIAEEATHAFLSNRATLDHFDFHVSDYLQSGLPLAIDIDNVPLLSLEKRSAVVREALAYTRDPEWVLEKLASNLEYFSKDDRSAIVSRVVQGQQAEKRRGMGGRGWHATLEKLIEKAEHLTPGDRASLVEESCTHGSSDSYLASAWAPVMHTLGESDQRRILTFVAADQYVHGGFSLEHLAEHADKLHPDLRDELADHVMALSEGRQGSSGAIRNLAKHLELFSEEKRAEIVTIVLDNLNASQHEEQNFSRPAWHQAPQFQAVEALHHLHRHQGLAGPEWGDVHETVAAIIEGSDIGAKTQLVAWMPEEQRAEHARQVLADARNQPPTPDLLALTTRVDVLSPELRTEYLKALRVKPIWRERETPMTRYNVRNNMDKFDPEERTVLVQRQLRVATNFPDQAGDIFGELAKIAPQVRSSDIQPIVRTAKDIAAGQRRDNPVYELGISKRACHAGAVRCVGKWCIQLLENARDMSRLLREREAAEKEGHGEERATKSPSHEPEGTEAAGRRVRASVR